MNAIIKGLEGVFNAIPLTFLEGWGRFGYLIGFMLMLAAFGGFTLRPGGRWGIGRERQTWDTKALLSMALTFVLVFVTGYIGSFIVLVPGAQTFESLKDLSVFLCIVLFGYPALAAVPFAYGLSDLIEGVPPEFLQDWLLGYFINPACVWVAFQLIGKNPDFRQARTWRWYALFVGIFMAIEPQLWGYICSGKFTSEISYRTITPALFFTTAVTWVIAPFAMLFALPLTKKLGLFWAHIPGHVKERRLGHKEWIWQSGSSEGQTQANVDSQGLPIRMFLAAPFIVLVLVMVGSVAYLTLRSGEEAANQLASRLHQEISVHIDLQLDEYLAKPFDETSTQRLGNITRLLKNSSVARQGRVFLIDRKGQLIASSGDEPVPELPTGSNDPIVQTAVRTLAQMDNGLESLKTAKQFRFVILTAKPLSRETWLAQATPYQDRSGKIDWIQLTAMPESAYLGGVRAGNSQSAMVLAVALTVSLLIAALLASMMAAPIQRISRSAQALAEGDLTQRVAGSKLEELASLAQYFNHMAGQLQDSMHKLEAEVSKQIHMKEALRHTSDRLQLATRAAHIGIWEWNVATNELIWDDAMYRLYGIHPGDFSGAYDAWSKSLHPVDKEQATRKLQEALEGRSEFNHEFRIVWPVDGSAHIIKAAAQTIRDSDGIAVCMIGVNFDVTESRETEEELRRHRDHLEELIADRTTELTVARDLADAANRAKSAFLSNMSHEIRTPMNAILGYTQLMQRLPDLPPTAANYASVIDRSSAHLMALINEVLEMSKIEAGRTVLQTGEVRFAGVMQDVEAMLRERAAEKALTLSVSIDERIPGALLLDATKLQQILVNVIGNAVKFTDHGGIKVHAYLEHQGAQDVIVAVDVTDSGLGIASHDLAKVFEMFEQTASGRDKGGTGLGMSISRRYARMMDGDITIESMLGVGTTVHFTFGATVADLGRTALDRSNESATVQLAPGSAMPKILIVDDVASNREILRLMLASVGLAQTLEAADGAQALEMVREWQPDLVLMDRRMPGMDGLQAIRLIRELPDSSKLRIIIVSASALDTERDDAYRNGADGFISKPFRQADLIAEIQRLCPAIVFHHGDANPGLSNPPITTDHAAAVARIGASLIAELTDLIECGDVMRFEHVLTERLQATSPILCAHLLKLAAKFDYARILAVLNPAIQTAGGRNAAE